MPPITLRPGLPAILQPADAGYHEARRAWNLAADLRPAAVARATTVAEVQDILAFAAEHELSVAPQATGHLAVALPPLERSVLLRTALEGAVEVDPVARRARVPAGATWEDVGSAAAPHGLAGLHGSAPDAGVVGYLLGGGLSFYGRRHGVAANHVTAIEVVTADGVARRVDGEHEPDLFWALRGGGGAFGVVTAVEIELFEIETVYAGALFWPVAEAPAVLRAWVAWCADAPDTVTTTLRFLCLPPVPEVPEPLRGVPVVTIDGALLGDAAEGAELLAPLRAVAPPMIDGWAQMPAAGVARIHGDPEQPVPGLSDCGLLDALDEAGTDALLALAGEGSGSPLLAVELRQLGGALAEAPAGAGVTGAIPGAYMLFGVGIPMTPELGEAIVGHLAALRDAMGPWMSDRTFLSFAERGGEAEACFAPEAYARLARARQAWDPDRRLVSSHRIS